jgi:hypothetical protein
MALHVYGVVGATPVTSDEVAGRGGRPVRLLGTDDLHVVVSEIAPDAAVKRSDLLAHAHVLEALCGATTVAPMQFGVVMPDEQTVRRELLEDRGDELRELLRAFDGYVQLTVSAEFSEPEALREVMQRSPELMAMRDAVRADAGDQAAELQLGEAVAADLERLRESDAAVITDRVARHAEAVALQDVSGALQVANVALLVRREARTPLDEAVAVLREDLRPRIRLRYVGPQPPYAFLEVRTGDLPWA